MSKKKEESPEGAKKRPLGIILISLIAVAASAMAGFTWYEMKGIKSQIAAGNADEKKLPEQEAPVPVAPVYLSLETFTVSLKPTADDSDRVLYIGLTFRLKEESDKKILEEYLPEVRSRLLVTFSRKTAAELATDEGKTQLIEQIKSETGKDLNSILNATITDVLFNAFIIR